MTLPVYVMRPRTRGEGGAGGEGRARTLPRTLLAALLRTLIATLATALCLAGFAAPPASAAVPSPVPPTDIALSWGDNNYGQLGNGTTERSYLPGPVDLPAGTRLTDITAGYFHGMGVTSNGRLLTWGWNVRGQLGVGTITNSGTPVEAHLPAGSRVTAIAAGFAHSLALLDDGRLFAWGFNSQGELGDGTTTQRNSPVEVHLPDGVEVTAIAASENGSESMALASDGRVFTWGSNNYGQLGIGTVDFIRHTLPEEVHLPAGTRATAISYGGIHGLALTDDNRLLAWGSNEYGQLGNGTTDSDPTPGYVDLPAGTDIAAIAAGGEHSMALTADGGVLVWGNGSFGNLGVGTSTNRLTPVPMHLPPGTRATAITASRYHSVVLTSDGSVYSTGFNTAGQLGIGTTPTFTLTPVRTHLPALRRATAIAAGGEFTLALAEEVAAESQTTLTANPTTSTPGRRVVLSSQVTCNAGTPTGDVVFYDGSTPIDTVAVNASGYAYTWVFDLAVGTHSITAHYLGDGTCPPSVSEPVTVTIEEAPAPSIRLTKQVASTGPFHVGDTVHYTYTVTDSGNTTLHDVTVTDSLIPTVTCDATTLQPGESTTCRGSYTVTEASIRPCHAPVAGGCEVVNLAQVRATAPDGFEYSSPHAIAAIVVLTQPEVPGLSLSKRAESTGPFQVGDTAHYTYTVINTGETALHGVTVTDNLVHSVTCDDTTLGRGESATCRGSYTVTEADAACGPRGGKGSGRRDGNEGYGGGNGGGGGGTVCLVTNTAHATATDPLGAHVTSNTAGATIGVSSGGDDGHDGYGPGSGSGSGYGSGYGRGKKATKSA
ncbi:Ig-like domain repeat protein [Streptomyces sp. NPDC046203]|uniref:RCC1 domain-containing protein n=1 Tax=Streptomyces sp. NPDC046203 TaxID=3154602 RepID=UPI003405B528